MSSPTETTAVFTALSRHSAPDEPPAALPPVTVRRARARTLLASQATGPATSLDPAQVATTIDPAELLAALRTSNSRQHREVVELTRLVLVADAHGLVLRCD